LFSFERFASTSPSCTASYPSCSTVFTCATTHGPALSTVAGCTRPSGWNSCVMPTFLPINPVTMTVSLSNVQAGAELLPVLFAERLDLDVHAGRQIQLHQRIDGLRRRLEDVDEPLVRADL